MYYSSANELLASSDVITVTAPHCHSDTPGHIMHMSDITIREFLGANDLHVLFLHVSVCQVAESGAVPPLTKILLLKTATGGEITWRSDLVHNLSVGPQDQLSFEMLMHSCLIGILFSFRLVTEAELPTWFLLREFSIQLFFLVYATAQRS